MELAVVLAGIFLLYLLQVVGYRLFWDKGLSVRFSFQREPVREGESACLYERLTNRKRLALPILYVMFDISRNGRACLPEENQEEPADWSKPEGRKEQEGKRELERRAGVRKPGRQKKLWFLSEILSLRANEEKERKIEIKGLKRGLYRIPELRLTTSNLFLTDRFSRSVVSGGDVARQPAASMEAVDSMGAVRSGKPVESEELDTVISEEPILFCDSSLYVYPKSLPEQELKPLFQLLSDSYRTERYSYEDDLELRGIRDYQSFDPMKRINWKASARAGRLQVNLMEYVASQQIRLVLAFDEAGEANQVETLSQVEPTNRVETLSQVETTNQTGRDSRIRTAKAEETAENRTKWTKSTEQVERFREYAISLAAGLADYCLEQGIPVGLISNGEDFLTEKPLRIEACGGKAGRESLQQGLSRLCFPRKLAEIEQILKEDLASEEEPYSENFRKGITYVILDASGGRPEYLAEGKKELGSHLAGLCQEQGRDCIYWEVSAR